MIDEVEHPPLAQDAAFQQYVADIEPLVERVAPEVHDDERALLGRLVDLFPSRTRSARQLTEADQVWLAALEEVAHRHGLHYELITHEGGDDTLWLIPPH